MAYQGWQNTSWDTYANGVHRPGVELAQDDQLERLRNETPSAPRSLTSLIVAVLFFAIVAGFIFFPQQVAAIFG